MVTFQFCWLFVPFLVEERQQGGEVGPLGIRRGIIMMSRYGSTKLGPTTDGYSGTQRWLNGRVKESSGYN